MEQVVLKDLSIVASIRNTMDTHIHNLMYQPLMNDTRGMEEQFRGLLDAVTHQMETKYPTINIRYDVLNKVDDLDPEREDI